MSILAIGDPHFKLDNNEETLQFTSEVEDYIKDNDSVELIVVLGDILHTHEKLHTFALNNAVLFFKTLLKYKKVCCLVGNHDATSNTIFLSDNHWMNILKGWKDLTIVDYPTQVQLTNFNITLCPYVPEGRFIEALNLIPNWKESDIIFGHQLLNGAKMGMIIAKDVEEWSEEYPLCISGHIHDKQWINKKLYYTGSSLQHSFADTDDKSIALITKNETIEIEEVYLQIRRKKIIYADVSQLKDLKEKLDKLQLDMEYKIVLSGNEQEFKAMKLTSNFKETLEKSNIKSITFKHKHKKEDQHDINNLEESIEEKDDFVTCLKDIVDTQTDPYLTSFFEHILYGKEDISDKDILFL
jgi:metallophosphoesterase superfamily enzyme